MKSSNDNYNFNQLPPDTSPGFVFFSGEEDGYFYFYFNDVNGKTLLYSEGYLSEKSRNTGHKSVLKNGVLENRYTIMSSGKKYFFVLKAGNHKEIARSRLFSSFELADEAFEWLKRNIDKKEGNFEQVESSVKPKIAKVKPTKKAVPKSIDLQPLKYHFRIDLYPDVENGPMKGKIENVLTGKKKSFSGLDQSVITSFIRNNVSEQDKKSLFIKKPIKSRSVTKTAPAPKAINFWEGQKKADNIAIMLKKDDQNKFQKHLEKNALFEIIMKPNEDIGHQLNTGDNLDMKIWIKSFGNNGYLNQWSMDVPLHSIDEVKLPRKFTIPETGIFHIRAIANNDKITEPLMGSLMLNVY